MRVLNGVVARVFQMDFLPGGQFAVRRLRASVCGEAE